MGPNLSNPVSLVGITHPASQMLDHGLMGHVAADTFLPPDEPNVAQFTLKAEDIVEAHGMLTATLDVGPGVTARDHLLVSRVMSFIDDPQVKARTASSFIQAIKMADTDYASPLRQAFQWCSEELGQLFRGTMVLQRISGKNHRLMLQLNLLRWQMIDGSPHTIKPTPQEALFIKKMIAGHISGLNKDAIRELVDLEVEKNPGLLAGGSGILSSHEAIGRYLEKKYPQGLTLPDCLSEAKLLRRSVKDIFDASVKRKEGEAQYQPILELASKLSASITEIVGHYYQQSESILSIWSQCGTDVEKIKLEIESLSVDEKKIILEFYFGKEGAEIIESHGQTVPDQKMMKRLSEPIKTRVLIYFLGRKNAAHLSEDKKIQRSHLEFLSLTTGMSSEVLVRYYFGDIRFDNAYYPSRDEIKKMAIAHHVAEADLLLFYYGDRLVTDLASDKNTEPSLTDLTEMAKRTECDLNLLESYYGVQKYRHEFGEAQSPSYQRLRSKYQDAELSRAFVYYYGRGLLPLLPVAARAPVLSVYEFKQLAKKNKVAVGKIWPLFFEKPLDDLYPSARVLYERTKSNPAEYYSSVEHYYGSSVRLWAESFKALTFIPNKKVSLEQVLTFCVGNKNLDADSILRFVYGRARWSVLKDEPRFIDCIKLVYGNAPAYGDLFGVARQAGLDFDDLFTRVYGAVTWDALITSTINRIQESTGVKSDKVMARYIEDQIHCKFSVDDLRALKNLQRYPAYRVISGLALLMNLDVQILCYLVNRKLLPALPSVFTRTDDVGELYPEYNKYTFVYQILSRIYEIADGRYWASRGVRRNVFHHFKQLYDPPRVDKIRQISEDFSIPDWLLTAFVIGKFYPDVRQLLDNNGYVGITFYIDSEHDPERVAHYLKNADGLGFKLWVSRKILGLTPVEFSRRIGMSKSDYLLLEEDKSSLPGYNLLGRLSSELGVPLEDLEQRAVVTYGDLTQEIAGKRRVGRAEAGSVKSRIMACLGQRALADYFVEATQAFKYLTGLEYHSARAWESLFELPTQNRSKNAGQAILTPETDLHLMQVLALSAKDALLDAPTFLATARPELSLLFPTFQGEKPFLELPDHVTLDDIFSISVPMQAARMIYEQKLSRGYISQQLGSDNNPMLATLYESMDYPILTIDGYKNQASVYGLDPRLLYLSRNPWLLLWVDVRGEASKKLIKWAPSQKQLAKILANYWQHQILDGRAYVKELLAAYQVHHAAAFIDRGGSEKLAKKLFVSHGRIKLYADELIEIKRLFPDCDPKKLLEGFKKGELLYFLGQKPDGSINYDLPDHWTLEQVNDLDLRAINQRIYEALQSGGQTFRQFWISQPGIGPHTSLNSFMGDKQELDLSRMVDYIELAKRVGITADEINLKALYLNQMTPIFDQMKP